jgi:hypothetical protein
VTKDEPNNANTLATISAHRLRTGGPAVTVLFITNSDMRADQAVVVTKTFRLKCDRLHTQPGRREHLRLLRKKNPTWKSCGEQVVTADLSESNHEDFRKTPGTSA